MMNNMYRQQPQQRYAQLGQPKQPKERKKQTRISISFKDEELWLYERLQDFSCPSAYVKDILKELFADERRVVK